MGESQAAAGDVAAREQFEQLFRRHHAAVLAYARRRAPGEVVDDVVGETFLVAWRRLEQVPAEELPWLLGVARNVLATQRRGASRRRALTSRLSGAEPEVGVSADLEAGDGVLLEALAKLAPKDREALTLIAWDGLAPHEAAAAVGDSPGTFRVRLYRARRRLRGLLEECPERVQRVPERRVQVEETAHG